MRTVTPQVQIDGEVRRDLFVTGIGASIGSRGSVGRDVIVFGGAVTIDGSVGRDVRGRMLNTSVGGSVGRDLDISVQRLVIEEGAAVAGDVLYRTSLVSWRSLCAASSCCGSSVLPVLLRWRPSSAIRSRRC
jgi:hypothetical protein